MKQHDKIIESLKQADETFQCHPLTDPVAMSKTIRARFTRRRQLRRNTAVISLLLIAGCLITYSRITHEKQVIRDMAYIKAQSQQLVQQSRLLASVAADLNAELENRREITKLQNELVSINRTIEGYQTQNDMIVFELLYKADKLAKDKSSIRQAVGIYNNMLKYFPESKHTDTARKRLDQLDRKQTELNKV